MPSPHVARGKFIEHVVLYLFFKSDEEQEALNLIHRFTNQSILYAELLSPCTITVVTVTIHQKILFNQNNLIKYKHIFL